MMDLEQMRSLIAETAKTLDEISAELQEALDSSNPTKPRPCGCTELTIEREHPHPFLVARCNRGKVTRIGLHYAQLIGTSNRDLIEKTAIRIAADHGLDVETVARDLAIALIHKDGLGTITVER